jgi:hypothetical protein
VAGILPSGVDGLELRWWDVPDGLQQAPECDHRANEWRPMERVTGYRGLLFQARDPDALARQYAANLGIEPVPAEDERREIAGTSRLVPDWPGATGDNQ